MGQKQNLHWIKRKQLLRKGYFNAQQKNAIFLLEKNSIFGLCHKLFYNLLFV